ncbi:MAG: hypothetical protein ACI4RN_02695 [Oscillospiraceae bacterium]
MKHKLSKKKRYDIEAVVAALLWSAVMFISCEFVGGIPALIIIALTTGIFILIDRVETAMDRVEKKRKQIEVAFENNMKE